MDLPGPSGAVSSATPGKRVTSPPRTLPNQFDDLILPVFDSPCLNGCVSAVAVGPSLKLFLRWWWAPYRVDPEISRAEAGQIPFSPTSPGKRSPGRPRSMKEYEEDLASLKKENFNLKVRIYFLEQHRMDPSVPKDVDELRHLYTNLKVEHDLQKKDLETKENLLLDTYKALDVQKQQLEGLTEERQELRCRIENLEKELKDYHQRFMETSVGPLDDTNALYTMTFGLNAKPGPAEKPDPPAEEKIRELQEELSREKERVLMLEEEMTLLNEKTEGDQKNLQNLVSQLKDMEENMKKILVERNKYEELFSNASSLSARLEKSLRKRMDVIKEKDAESEKWQSLAEELRKQLTKVESQLQEVQERNNKSQSEKQIKTLYAENEKLKHEVRYLQHLAEKRTSKCRGSDREADQELRESQRREAELTRELELLRGQLVQSKGFIQTMVKEKKQLQAQLERAKRTVNSLSATSVDAKEEVNRFIEEGKEMSSHKDNLISELQAKIEELTQVIAEKDGKLQELKDKLDSVTTKAKCDSNVQFPEGITQKDKDGEILQKEMQEKNKEIENLKKDLKKKTFNLQGLVNKELWDKNREIEKLNKLCERQHVEMLSLEKQLRECQLTMMQDKVNSFTSTASFKRGIFDDKENLQPITDSRVQIQHLMEEKRALQRKVEELQARLLNTPERDKESEQLQTLRADKDAAEAARREAVNACVLLTTRLQELADFLESLLPLLCGKRRKYVQQAVERSRELSRSLSLAAEESSLLQCSTWTDLQPSLVVPLLPDISTVDFWSADEVEEVTQHPAAGDNPFLDSVFNFDGKNFSIENRSEENPFDEILANITEGSAAESENAVTRVTPVKSVNIGKITLTSKKKEVGEVKTKEDKDGSECETWSEPDRDVSYARMGLKEDPAINKSTQFGFEDTSETAESIPKSPLSRRGSEIQRLQRKCRNLEQVNAALRSELVILHQLTPASPALARQDKSTSISELSRQSSFSVPAHLLEEIRNQREKLEASLFHNDYIRRQLESTVSSLQRNQGDQDNTLIVRLKEVTSQLETTENEASELKKEKENLNTKVEFLHASLQKTSDELKEKQQCLEKLESETARQIDEIKEKYSTMLSEYEQKCSELEKKSVELEKRNSELSRTIEELNDQIVTLTREIENHLFEGKKNKQLNDELNVKLQQIDRQKDELQKLTAEQEQLLTDAERERQELATQLIARDREVSELSKRCYELTNSELEAALRSQLELATQQCAQFESRNRDLDSRNKRYAAETVDLQRRLDAARYAHSEAVLQYTRAANDNIRLQQELRARTHNDGADTNQMAQAERMRAELERRVMELEAANAELGTKLASLNILPMSDYETDAASSAVGSPPRRPLPPLTLSSPTRPPPLTSPARSHDFTSDYLSDQEAALSSPRSQVRGLWFPVSPHSHMSASPDLGIESDHGRFSSLDTQPKSTAVSLRGTPVKDLMKLEEENTQLRLNLQKTRHALEETLAQLTAANQHKRQYEAQLSAANQRKAQVERAICRQLNRTHNILKKARENLGEDGKSDRC